MAMLEADKISATYGALNALTDITLSLEKGGRLAIFGHNGAGKTTLLKCLIGAHPVSAGQVLYEGKPVAAGQVSQMVRRGLAFVPQGHNVFPNLSVERNLTIAGLLFDRAFMAEVYRLFPVLEERKSQRAGSLSGGEQQMLALGMAMMTRPKWLLLDEPSTGLAPVIVRTVMQRLRAVNESLGTGLVLVEQNVPATLRIVDQAIILKSGRVVFAGASEKLSADTELWRWF
jgi:branched-chain amino acid transport system ATP-binding protein